MSKFVKASLVLFCLAMACGKAAVNTNNNQHGVTLTWTAPTTNTDGSALTDLQGYRLYQGPSTGAYGPSTDLGAASCTAGSCTYNVPNLTAGTYFFAVTAYNGGGYESVFSNEATATVP